MRMSDCDSPRGIEFPIINHIQNNIAKDKDVIPKAHHQEDSGPPTERINITKKHPKPSQFTIELINRYTPITNANNEEVSKMQEILNDTLEDVGLKQPDKRDQFFKVNTTE
mgnify:CR=1 FL=1